MLGLVCMLAAGCCCQDPAAATLAELRQLAREHPARLRLEEWGRSRKDRPILAAVVGSSEASADAARVFDRRPAILVVAGLDGRRIDDRSVAMQHIRDLVTSQDPARIELLRHYTLYVIPMANPDAAALAAASNGAPVDEDRDGREGEDAPDDLNGDGKILWMRVPDAEGEWIVDPSDAHTMRKADPDKGERGRFRLLREGKDDDHDNRYNEDAPGGVLLDRNFPQLYPEHEQGAGRYALSEPAALALAKFVLGKPNIGLVISYGDTDNLLADARKNDRKERRAPTGVLSEDAWIYAELGKRYRKATGRKGKNVDVWPGRFHAWVYAHAGRPCLATSLIDRSKDIKDASEGVRHTAWILENFGDDAWTEWQPFEHETLGKIEIGGLQPGLEQRIPSKLVAKVASDHLEFLLKLFPALSKPRLAKTEIERVSATTQEIRATVVNEGFLPPRIAMADKLRTPRLPRIALLVPEGDRLTAVPIGERIPSLVMGSPWSFVTLAKRGSSAKFRWIVRAASKQHWTLRVIQERMVHAEQELVSK